VTEEMLAISTVTHMRYDGRRLILSETFEDCRLRNARHIVYDPATGRKTRELSIWFSRDGSKTIETSHEVRRPRSSEYVCATGGDISYVTGPVPSEYDPLGGYGSSVDGLALRLSPSAERSRFEGLSLTLTVRNFGAAPAEAPSWTPYMPVEIRDGAGDLVPMLPWRRATFDQARAGMLYESRRDCRGSSVDPDTAEWVTHYDVNEEWGTLPPGNYSAVAKCCLPGRGEDALTSNVVRFTVLAE